MGEFNLEEILSSEIFQNPIVLIAIAAVAAIILLLIAFNSYRIFRGLLALGGAAAAGYAGYFLVGPMVVEDNMIVQIVIAVILAILGALIAFHLYKLAIFAAGAYGGFIASPFALGFLIQSLPDVAFFQEETGAMVVSIVCAVLAGVITLLLFKHVFIIGTSFGICVPAFVLVGVAVMFAMSLVDVALIEGIIAGTADPAALQTYLTGLPMWLVAFPGAGVLFSIFAIVNQYKQDKKRRD